MAKKDNTEVKLLKARDKLQAAMDRGSKRFQEKVVASKNIPEVKRIYRSNVEKVLGGVCGGFAEYFQIDPVLVRLVWILFCLLWGIGIILYVISWIIIPQNPNKKL